MEWNCDYSSQEPGVPPLNQDLRRRPGWQSWACGCRRDRIERAVCGWRLRVVCARCTQRCWCRHSPDTRCLWARWARRCEDGRSRVRHNSTCKAEDKDWQIAGKVTSLEDAKTRLEDNDIARAVAPSEDAEAGNWDRDLAGAITATKSPEARIDEWIDTEWRSA